MIDLSDGLATDLGHLCRESRVGARVSLSRLPIPGSVTGAALALGLDPVRLALSGGEDFELLFALPMPETPEWLAELERETGTKGTVIGELLAGDAGVQFIDEQGARVAVEQGFEHFSTRPDGVRV
jgi:thiamine-monophosphate kinase